jgi:predicted lipoprotein with Yx(FWY)xxD motif
MNANRTSSPAARKAAVTRASWRSQWAYDGKPLYFYAGDKKKGDMAGDGKGGVWHIVKE